MTKQGNLALPYIMYRQEVIGYKFQNIVDAAVERFANLLNTIERNIIVTLDTGNDISTKACFLHQLSVSQTLVDQQVK